MNNGYVKLWRKSIEAGWLTNHKLWVFWSWCLMKASHKEYDLVVGCQQIHLMPGQFVFGLNSASKETNISIQSIRTLLDFLKKSENLTIKSTNKYSIITIIKWNTYQSTDNESNNQINKPLTNNQQTTNNKQECKNVKKNIYTSEFLQFYNAYPKHIGKEPAWKAWVKLNGERPPVEELVTKINQFKKTDGWKKDNGQYIPHPATWLNQKRWNDEIETHPPTPPTKVTSPFLDCPVCGDRIMKADLLEYGCVNCQTGKGRMINGI